jgi:hypothetical protein
LTPSSLPGLGFAKVIAERELAAAFLDATRCLSPFSHNPFPITQETHMITSKKIYLLFIALLCSVVVGCASTASRESTGQYVDDSVITTKVKYAIAQDPQLKLLEVKVETFKGRVQLSGFVSSQADIARAEEIARNITGVKSVANDLRLK